MVLGSLARPRAVGAALVAAGALVVAGCSGSDEDAAPSPTGAASATTVTSTPSPTETAEPSPTETSALPPLPDAAKENTPEGAEAFIRYYFDVVNQLHREPRSDVLGALTDADCESCANAEDTIAYLIEQAAHLESDLYEIDELSRLGGGDPGVTRFNASWRGPGTRVVTADGEILDEIPASVFEGVMAAKWTGDKWVFYDSAVSES